MNSIKIFFFLKQMKRIFIEKEKEQDRQPQVAWRDRVMNSIYLFIFLTQVKGCFAARKNDELNLKT